MKKLIKGVIKLIQSIINPVYLLDDVPNKYNPNKKTILKNNIKKKINNEELNIVSWNILRNYNNKKIKESILKIIKNENPDIIIIQEAPAYNNSNFWDNKMFKNFNIYYAPLHQVKKQTKFYNFAHSGQLTLSRYKFTKTKTYQLPSVAKQTLGKDHIIKRIVIYTQLKSRSKTIGIYNVHLENIAWQDGRRKQIKYLLEIINKNKDDIILIGGDFNTFLGFLERGISTLEKEGFEKLMKGFRYFPRLDHFFVKGCKAKKLSLKGSGSDHQPIGIEIKVKRPDRESNPGLGLSL